MTVCRSKTIQNDVKYTVKFTMKGLLTTETETVKRSKKHSERQRRRRRKSQNRNGKDATTGKETGTTKYLIKTIK